jgi:hypothetical protein
MGNAKVSQGFGKFYNKSARAVEEAKKAENTMATCKPPIGHKGDCILLNAFADATPEKKDEKSGLAKGGTPYIRWELSIVGDGQYTGTKAVKTWWFNDTANATYEDRLKWFMIEMTRLGLPDEIKKEHKDISEILNYFLGANLVFGYEVVAAAWNKNDGKEIQLSAKQVVDDTDATVPGTTNEDMTFEEGQEVPYEDGTWKIIDIDGKDITIKSLVSNQKRIVTAADLKG